MYCFFLRFISDLCPLTPIFIFYFLFFIKSLHRFCQAFLKSGFAELFSKAVLPSFSQKLFCQAFLKSCFAKLFSKAVLPSFSQKLFCQAFLKSCFAELFSKAVLPSFSQKLGFTPFLKVGCYFLGCKSHFNQSINSVRV